MKWLLCLFFICLGYPCSAQRGTTLFYTYEILNPATAQADSNILEDFIQIKLDAKKNKIPREVRSTLRNFASLLKEYKWGVILRVHKIQVLPSDSLTTLETHTTAYQYEKMIISYLRRKTGFGKNIMSGGGNWREYNVIKSHLPPHQTIYFVFFVEVPPKN